MQLIKHFSDIEVNDLPLVGGKGLNLGRLTCAGFQVPKGFCVTTDAYRLSLKHLPEQNENNIKNIDIMPELVNAVLEARQGLHSDTVAVRSSATAEDLEEASFAGQQDSFLNVKTDDLLDALKRCWASLWTVRAISYRNTKGIPNDGLAMGIVVQEMCNADVSGVLFTVSPFNRSFSIVESNWGLGESVVSGSITPDNFEISRDTGDVVISNVATKHEMVTESGTSPVSDKLQNTPSLTTNQLKRLCNLGIAVETLYEKPMDIEWSLTDDTFQLLQARPITTEIQKPEQDDRTAVEIEKLRQAEIQILKTIAKDNTIWSHHNLAEVLPTPLPMTWTIIKKFMSGEGGLGNAYRALGFYPSKQVDRTGILDLVCGRVYVNLNRESELFFDGFPFTHNFYELKLFPQQAMYAQAKPDIRNSTRSFWLKLPQHIIRMTKAEIRLRKYRSDFDRVLIEEIFPDFQQIIETEQKLLYSELSDVQLVQKVRELIEITLDDFAPKTLIATILAGFSLQRLETVLQKKLSEKDAKALASRLITGQSGNITIETNEKLRQVATGKLLIEDFLKEFGHRAVDEFELAQPRWRENTDYLEQIIESMRHNQKEYPAETDLHFSKQKEHQDAAEKELAELTVKQAGLQKQIEHELNFTRRFMPFRETAKYYLMLGYEQIRRALVELDNRYELDGDVFYLVPDELEKLINEENLRNSISERKLQRELLLQIDLPDVIFSDSLEEIGKSQPIHTSDTYSGVGVSAGVGLGHARVLLSPSDIRPSDQDYILVCPSTDPAWTPLFLNASGLVMERGGILSHGAVVAREYGVAAVANIPNATQNIKDGQMIQVDGNQGTVSVLSDST